MTEDGRQSQDEDYEQDVEHQATANACHCEAKVNRKCNQESKPEDGGERRLCTYTVTAK